jgi:hypothetical protein
MFIREYAHRNTRTKVLRHCPEILQTTTAPPTSASSAALVTLTSNGWTVTHD